MYYPPQPRPGARYPSPRQRPPSPAANQGGCLNGFLLGTLLFLILLLCGMGGTLIGYATVARDLPQPGQLMQRTRQLQTTRIYDRNGVLLQEPLAPDDPTAGLRERVTLSDISPYLIDATLATEDANYYSHPGVDPVSLGRAVFQALRRRGAVVGTSTISQQLVKLVFLSPERTISRKVKEAILAAEITRRYDKDTVLEIYLNEIYYGNLAYGVEAAAQILFNTSARDLSLAQAALLAGLPQSPATYDPLQNPDAAKARQADVLRLMVQHGKITPEQADAAWLEPLSYYGQGLQAIRLDNAPHFVMFVRSQVEQYHGPELLYGGGLRIYTTLDLELQQEAERAVEEELERLSGRNASNSALVALRPTTGEILAMVGSADFNNQEIDGQVNVALAPRQPGSAIKPFTYLATFERQADWWTPATLVDDVRTEFDDGPGRPPYVPRNYDGKDHGWVSVRSALANSYNIPAVKALDHVGVDALLDIANRLGLSTLTRPGHPPYGLALTLGGGEVTLLELTGAYAALANSGVSVPPNPILCILSAEGELVERLDVPNLPAPCQDAPLAANAFVQEPRQAQAISAQHAYLLTDILKDNQAREPVFGSNSWLRLDRPAAVKTGTTNDVRDGWTVGYTPDLVTGIWVGNSDGTPMDASLSGSQVAAPIWNRFMRVALTGLPPQEFPVPDQVQFVEICTVTGAVPDASCPADRRRTEVFAAGQLPPGADASRYQVLIAEPADGAMVQGVVRVVGTVVIPDLDYFLVEYGESFTPGAWGQIGSLVYGSVQANQLALWDLRGLSKDGPHVLRVVAVDRQGIRYESAPVRVSVVRPTETAQPTASPTPTLTPSPSPTGTPSATPTPSLLPATPTPILPTNTPLPPLPPSPTPILPTATPVPASPTPILPTNTPLPPLPATSTPTAVSLPPTATPSATPQPTPTTAVSPGVQAELSQPQNGASVSGLVTIVGQATGAGFVSYQLEYAQGTTWQPIDPLQPISVTPRSGVLGTWDTTLVPNGPTGLRLLVQGIGGQVLASSVVVTVAN